MNLEQGLEHVASGEGVLFLGAGFSRDATNIKNQNFKTGSALAKFLCARISLPDNTPLEDAAELFSDKYGVDELIKELRREYTAKNVTDAQRTIASLPWKRTYTTNYDNVFERAATDVNKVVVPIGPDAASHLTAKQDPLCIHLNGYINELNRETIHASFKLTDTSYATASLEKSEWAALFRQDVRFARAVFFVGYSLFDLDIKRILRNTPDLADKTFFIQHKAVDPVTSARAQRYGQLITIGVKGLSSHINNGDFLTPRKPKDLNIGRSIVEYDPPLTTHPPTDREFLNLIMLGEFNPALAVSDLHAEHLYCCDRESVIRVLDRIDHKLIRAAVLHSDIANGRSVSLALLARDAVARGWRVFYSTELSEHAERELRAVAELPGKVLLLIDDYVGWLRQLQGITAISSDRFAIVISARSNAHDIAADDLEELLHPLSPEEYCLDLLSKSELEWWVATLDTYGLWGNEAGLSSYAKARYLADMCGRKTQGILIKLFDSPQIRNRLKNAATAIRSNPLVEKIAITTFVLTVLNQRPTIETITDIWGVDALVRENVRSNEGLANFIDISRSHVRVRSTTAAEFLLKNFWCAEEVISVVLEIASVSERLYRFSVKYEGLFKTIIRFSSIQRLLPAQGMRDAVVSYYENLKLLDRCKKYPLFWLQYAIGALVIGDLQRASRYFDTSYALANKLDWNTFQIDNHYARYLLVRATEEAPFKECMTIFRQARTLINRQIKTDRLHYPFRVATNYQGIYDRFCSQFSEDELKEISEACETVLDRISQLAPDRAQNKHVKKCQDALSYVRDSVGNKLHDH